MSELPVRAIKGLYWERLDDVIVDGLGRYVLVTPSNFGDKCTVVCFDPDSLAPVWTKSDVLRDRNEDVRLAGDKDGNIYVWQKRRHSAVVLDKDGVAVGKIGGREPATAKKPFLDFADADDFFVDDDGSFLLVGCNRLQRFGKDFHGVHTWPQEGLRSVLHDKLEPLYRHVSETERHKNDYDDDVTYWKKRPLGMYSSDVLGVVAGGAMYLLTDYGSEESAVARFDKDGDVVWCVRVTDMKQRRPAVDRDGNVFVVSERNNRKRLHRLPADGKTKKGGEEAVWLGDWRDGGVVVDPEHVTVDKNGVVGLWDDDSEVTFIGPDRQVKLITDRAEKTLRQKQAERERMVALDEDVD